jgi:hypothetical protein
MAKYQVSFDRRGLARVNALFDQYFDRLLIANKRRGRAGSKKYIFICSELDHLGRAIWKKVYLYKNVKY